MKTPTNLAIIAIYFAFITTTLAQESDAKSSAIKISLAAGFALDAKPNIDFKEIGGLDLYAGYAPINQMGLYIETQHFEYSVHTSFLSLNSWGIGSQLGDLKLSQGGFKIGKNIMPNKPNYDLIPRLGYFLTSYEYSQSTADSTSLNYGAILLNKPNSLIMDIETHELSIGVEQRFWLKNRTYNFYPHFVAIDLCYLQNLGAKQVSLKGYGETMDLNNNPYSYSLQLGVKLGWQIFNGNLQHF